MNRGHKLLRNRKSVHFAGIYSRPEYREADFVRQVKKRSKTVSSAVEKLMIILVNIFSDFMVLFFDIADALSYTADNWETAGPTQEIDKTPTGMAGSLFDD